MCWIPPVLRADTSGMRDFTLEELARHEQSQELLSAYYEKQLAAQRLNTEHDGWVSRIQSLAEIADGQLPRVHGKLIALGLLQFQLAGRTGEGRYQVSPLGVRALAGGGTPFQNEMAIDDLPISAA
jgi:hypothetical protein